MDQGAQEGSWAPILQREEASIVSSLMMSFQREDRPPQRQSRMKKLARGFQKRFASQRGKERFYNDKFSNVNALRKGSRGTSAVRPSGFCKGLGAREPVGSMVKLGELLSLS